MTAVRKIFGIFLIIIGSLLSLSLIVAILKALMQSIGVLGKSTYEGIGFLFGIFIMTVIFGIIIYFIFKYGFKLLKTKALPQDTIDDIGLTK
ncbi:putative membrane protein [Flavobacterium sp. 2755]|uniref:hypothetical protein n=1 Tax=Flavobacterium sp. 2755 TaxID=2817765 RepID=UPI002860C9B8|nr:hypothetical protein [Flavobacterium sp. 2755]MDR6762234.1 putative membrane protein [Flavobacterium sp. 2755]